MKNLFKIQFKVSSRKFYEIVAENKEILVPKTPEEFIISKYLKDQSPIITYDNNKKQSAVKKHTQINYQEIIQKYPHGSIIEQKYKGL